MRWLQLRYASKRLFAQLLARFELHRVRVVQTQNGPMVWKTRRRASQVAVLAGNLYLRMQRADVEILSTEEWLRWEAVVRSVTRNDELDLPTDRSVSGNALITRQLPGESLQQILADATRSLNDKLLGIGWALRSLDELHGRSADWGNGLFQPISHGDATAENVILDTSAQSASWIDFDTRHRSSLGTRDRQASDLRALLLSAAVHLPPSAYPELRNLVDAAYASRDVIAQFLRRLSAEWQHPNTFELAQAPLPFAGARKLCEVFAPLP